MSTTRQTLLLAALLAAVGTSQAADFTFSGNISLNTDIVQINFSLLNDATDVKVWTDSFDSGTNFDPITALWQLPDGNRIDENDDDDSIAPGQTFFDSGFNVALLPAGNYVYTVAAYDNFAGNNLSDPFAFAGVTPEPISTWCQLSSDNCLNHKGTFWRVNLSGVDAAGVVPEPQSYALMLLGLVGVVAMRCKPRV